MDTLGFLQNLVDQQLCYGLKSPDMDLYDFGFSRVEGDLNPPKKDIYTLFLHATCRFKVIWKNGESRVDKYDENTPHIKFHSEIKRLIGLKVRRVELSDKNDLWLDFGDYWVVFATFKNNQESWRLFTTDTDTPHLVASDTWLHFSPNKKTGDGL